MAGLYPFCLVDIVGVPTGDKLCPASLVFGNHPFLLPAYPALSEDSRRDSFAGNKSSSLRVARTVVHVFWFIVWSASWLLSTLSLGS